MIMIVGGGGIPNYGDELIINNWLRWYSETSVAQSHKITVEGAKASVMRNMFADRFPKVQWSHAMRSARLQFRSSSFWGALGSGLDAAASTLDPVRQSFSSANEASLLHIHGGGYINGKWPSHAFVLGLAAAAHASSGTRAVATGIGLSPVKDPDNEEKKLLDKAVDGFEFIEVRDEWSYRFLTDNLSGNRTDKILFGLDDAFLYPVKVNQTEHKTLHLSLRDDPAGESTIDRLTNKFVGSFDRHRFWVCKPSDAAAYVKLTEKFRMFELAGPSQLVENPYLSPQDVMITERFHPHLQGARVGAKGAFWSGSEYYDTKHGSLVEIGSTFTPDNRREYQVADFSTESSKMAANDASYVARKQEVARRAVDLLG